MEFTDKISESINKYFSILSHTGYKAYNEVDKLLVLIFLEEILCGPMSEFLTDEDYKDIYSSIECLYGSCMIPYPSNNKVEDMSIRRVKSCIVKK